MPIPVEQFPILTAGQMNPFNQAFTAGLDAYQKGVKNTYLPQTLQADIASKNAYAQNYYKQMAATILSNPLAIATMSNEQRNKLLGTVIGDSNPSMNLQQSNVGGGMWDGFKNLISGGNAQNTQPQSSGGMQFNGGQQDMTNINNMRPGESYVVGGQPSTQGQDVGDSNRASPEMVADIAKNGNRAYQNNNVSAGSQIPNVDLSDPKMNLYGKDFGSPSANSAMANLAPSPYQKLMMKQAGKQIDKNVDTNSEMWKDRLDQSNKQAADSQNYLSTLEGFHNSYKKLSDSQKGFFYGRLPAGTDSQAQIADQFAQNLLTTNLRALQTGHITNTDFAIGETLKPGRYLNSDAEQAMSDYYKGLFTRMKERQSFNNKAKQLGYEPSQADTLWSQYINDKKFFDPAKQKIIEKNLNSWPEYLQSKKANAILNGDQQSEIGTNWVRDANGKLVSAS